MIKLILIFFVLSILESPLLWAEPDPAVETQIETTPQTETITEPAISEPLEREITPPEPSNNDSLLSAIVMGSLDVSYGLGGAIHQGFLIPSARLGVEGSLRRFPFQIQLGQVREISSTFIEEVRPIDVWLQVPIISNELFSSAVKTGLFYPGYDGIYDDKKRGFLTPELPRVVQWALPIRDVGMLLETRWNIFSLDAGIFNGHSVHTLNSNHSRALLGRAKIDIQYSRWDLAFGVTGYTQLQGSLSSVNYKNVSWNAIHAMIIDKSWNLRLQSVLYLGAYEDSSYSLNPEGWVCELVWREQYPWGAFVRWEKVSHLLGVADTQLFQGGPRFQLNENVSLMTYYQLVENSLGDETSFQVLLRAAL